MWGRAVDEIPLLLVPFGPAVVCSATGTAGVVPVQVGRSGTDGVGVLVVSGLLAFQVRFNAGDVGPNFARDIVIGPTELSGNKLCDRRSGCTATVFGLYGDPQSTSEYVVKVKRPFIGHGVHRFGREVTGR